MLVVFGAFRTVLVRGRCPGHHRSSGTGGLANGWPVEKIGDRQFQTRPAQPGADHRHGQGVAAQGEEVVQRADGVHAKGLLPHGGDLPLDRGLGSDEDRDGRSVVQGVPRLELGSAPCGFGGDRPSRPQAHRLRGDRRRGRGPGSSRSHPSPVQRGEAGSGHQRFPALVA